MTIKEINKDLCNGCGECVKSCAVDVIRMNEEEKKAFIAYPQDCMLCELCTFFCPVDAITLIPKKSTDVMASWG
ncbi:MAG: 4Fe-4S binding protein [Deltaproteobacteria bacterium]|jgi:ferredoxin|nr:4Fe-4S binding protein [Deltaproteobacteria bacterium]MBW1861009.1 4Fe-4S binding protein [Deltaproteobacteria bacterium]